MEINFADGAIIGKRDEQQDYKANLILADDYLLYILADGMGGQIGGAIASKLAVHGIMAFFSQRGVSEDPIADLKAAAQEGNKALTERLRKEPQLNGMGTTLILVLHYKPDNRFWFVSIGDSPLYQYDPARGLQRINANHAYYEQLLEEVAAGRLDQDEADNHPQRHAITSAVMGKTINLIDAGSGVLQAGQRLLLASDGVETLNDQPGGELEALLASQSALTDIVSSVLDAVTARGLEYQDNTSLVLVAPYVAPVSPEAAPEGANSGEHKPALRTTERVAGQRHKEVSGAEKRRGSSRWLPYAVGLLVLVLLLLVGMMAWDTLFDSQKPAPKKIIYPAPGSTSVVPSPDRQDSPDRESVDARVPVSPTMVPADSADNPKVSPVVPELEQGNPAGNPSEQASGPITSEALDEGRAANVTPASTDQ